MNVVCSLTTTLVLALVSASGQEPPPSMPVPLSQLVAEAQANNTQIASAQHEAQAARMIVPQVTALPDTKFTVQQLSVGSPRPFAGYTNSDFAYIGVGVSQELPYPGKLRLRGQVAEADAATKRAEVEVTKTSVVDAVKMDYLQLAYLQQTLGILRQHESILDQLIQAATAHYQVGQGMQQDVLQAQVERTKIVREITMHHQNMARLEAHLKSLLHREQSSLDIVTEELTESPFGKTSLELLDLVRQRNPQVHADASAIRKEDAHLASTKRDSRPDFGISYMYQNTDRRFRDYYMLTLDVRLPRRTRVNAEIGEAVERLAESQQLLDSHLQQQLAEAQQQYAQIQGDAELLKEYREGLLPQSDAAYRATLSSYAANREQFTHVLSYFTDFLNLKLQFAETLADHETALAHLESLTGASLR